MADIENLDVAMDVAVAVVAVLPGAVEEAVAVALAFAAAVALTDIMTLDLAVAVAEDVEVAMSGAVGAAVAVADGCRGVTGEERRVGSPRHPSRPIHLGVPPGHTQPRRHRNLVMQKSSPPQGGFVVY